MILVKKIQEPRLMTKRQGVMTVLSIRKWRFLGNEREHICSTSRKTGKKNQNECGCSLPISCKSKWEWQEH